MLQHTLPGNQEIYLILLLFTRIVQRKNCGGHYMVVLDCRPLFWSTRVVGAEIVERISSVADQVNTAVIVPSPVGTTQALILCELPLSAYRASSVRTCHCAFLLYPFYFARPRHLLWMLLNYKLSKRTLVMKFKNSQWIPAKRRFTDHYGQRSIWVAWRTFLPERL